MVFSEKIRFVLEITYCFKWALAVLWRISWHSSPLENGTLLCTLIVLHLKISHAGSHLLKKVRSHMYLNDVTITKKKKKIKWNAHKIPTKPKVQKKCEPFHLFLYSKRQEAFCPSSKVAKNVKQTCISIWEVHSARPYQVKLVTELKLTKKQETRWLTETLVSTCRLPFSEPLHDDSKAHCKDINCRTLPLLDFPMFALKWVLPEVRTAWGTQLADAHLHHILSTFAVATLR